jgi:hypothetical protein
MLKGKAETLERSVAVLVSGVSLHGFSVATHCHYLIQQLVRIRLKPDRRRGHVRYRRNLASIMFAIFVCVSLN